MTKAIFILVIVLIVLVFIAITMARSNHRLRKEIKQIKESVSAIQEKEKKYDKIKESFHTGNDSDDVSAINDFLHNHKRNKD